MTRWLTYFSILGLATVLAIAVGSLPTDAERAHAQITPGMTQDEVVEVMSPASRSRSEYGEYRYPGQLLRTPTPARCSWLCPGRFGMGKLELIVDCDDDGRVTGTAVERR
jgi:hypothetical protein